MKIVIKHLQKADLTIKKEISNAHQLPKIGDTIRVFQKQFSSLPPPKVRDIIWDENFDIMFYVS